MKPIQRLWWQLLRIEIAFANAGDAAKEERQGINRLNDALRRNVGAK